MGAGVAGACVLVWFVALSVYDVRQRRLPNWLTLPGALMVMAVAALCGRGVAALAGAVALTVLYLVIHLVAPAGMGAGDVKLAIGVGALTGAFGFDAWVLSALAAPMLTTVWGVAVALRGMRTPATVPHGPAMCLTAAAAVALAVGLP